MPETRIEVAEALEQLILTLMREALTCGVTEASINDLAQHTMDNRGTILSALRDAGTGRDSGEAASQVVLRDLSPDEAQTRYQALIDARWRERVADSSALADPSGGGKP